MKKSCVCILVFVLTMICLMGEENVYVLAETVSDNQLLEEQQTQGQEINMETEFKLSGYCGEKSENDGKNVLYTISDSDNDGIYDLLEIKGQGGIRGTGNFSSLGGDITRLENPLPWQEVDENHNIRIEKVIIKDGITYIGDAAFSGCKLINEIVIPQSVKDIGSFTFYGCMSLIRINLPNNIKFIGMGVFSGCTSLREINIPDSVTFIYPSAFSDCSSLREIRIPDNVTSIGHSVFWGCSSLRKIRIPDSVSSIGWGAFFGCSSLKEINIPETAISIDNNAFCGCELLTKVVFPPNVSFSILTGQNSLPAFTSCNSLEIVFIPNNCINVEFAGFPMSTSQVEYVIDNTGNAHISNIKLGKECALVEIPDMLYNYSILSVDESFRSLVSETGHTHKYNEAGICQICNKRKEQDEGAGIDTDIPEGPDTWKSKEGVEGFVFRLYNVAMHRDAEETGLNDWNTRLNTKEETAAQVAWGFIFSKEFENFNYNDVQYVKLLYRTMFGREADKDGLEGWVSDLENGMSREYVFHGFAESQEFTNLCGNFGVERGNVSLNQYRDCNVGATGFIARLYTQMLGRGFDEEGIEYWCRKYLTGENTIEEVATVGFLHSKELENLNLSDTEFVTRMYRTFLNREPDEAGLADWVNRLETGRETRDSLVYGFTLSKEFGNIKASYGL